MRNQRPTFEITNEIISQVMKTAELVGELTVLDRLAANSTWRRRNRVRMIYGSLALEQNALTLEQAMALTDGRRIIAPLKDIAEWKNAWEAYEDLARLDPFSIDALLDVHRTMMHSLEGEMGVFRPKKVNLVDESGQILHFGTLPDYYSKLVAELLDWVKNDEMPMLVKSCVFRYEFERIHPFANGTGRLSRLWHTLFLIKWNPLFAWIPVDAVIQERQKEYYKIINVSNDSGETVSYIRFLLASINTSLARVIDENERYEGCKSDGIVINVIDEKDENDVRMSDESDELKPPEDRTEEQMEGRNIPRWEEVQQFLSSHELVRNADIRTLFGVSPATANRILAGLATEGKLVKCHEGGHWAYRLRK